MLMCTDVQDHPETVSKMILLIGLQKPQTSLISYLTIYRKGIFRLNSTYCSNDNISHVMPHWIYSHNKAIVASLGDL